MTTPWPPEPTSPEERWAAHVYDERLAKLLHAAEYVDPVLSSMAAAIDPDARGMLADAVADLTEAVRVMRVTLATHPTRDLPTIGDLTEEPHDA